MFTDIHFLNLDTVDSTNEFAKKNQDCPHPNVVYAIIARDQTKGKGRFGKNWESKKDASILMTLTFNDQKVTLPHQFTQILAYSACQFFQEIGLNLEMKWPNDLFYNGKKIGGILLEKHLDRYILGIGINCNQKAADLSHIDQKCTSYLLETGRLLFVEEASKVLAKIFLKHLNQLITHGFKPFYHMINEQFLLTGEAIWSEEPKKLFGRIISLDPDGYLIFESDGEKKVLQSGSLAVSLPH